MAAWLKQCSLRQARRGSVAILIDVDAPSHASSILHPNGAADAVNQLHRLAA